MPLTDRIKNVFGIKKLETSRIWDAGVSLADSPDLPEAHIEYLFEAWTADKQPIASWQFKWHDAAYKTTLMVMIRTLTKRIKEDPKFMQTHAGEEIYFTVNGFLPKEINHDAMGISDGE